MSVNTRDNVAEGIKTSVRERSNQLESLSCETEIESILGQNFQVKKDLARQLHEAGLSMEAIGKILNLRARTDTENHSK